MPDPVDYTQTQYQPGVDPELDKRIAEYMKIDSTAGSGRWAGGGRSEAQAMEQWAQWDGFRDPNCPPSAPFPNEEGIPGCYEKPVDTPPGVVPGTGGRGVAGMPSTGDNHGGIPSGAQVDPRFGGGQVDPRPGGGAGPGGGLGTGGGGGGGVRG